MDALDALGSMSEARRAGHDVTAAPPPRPARARRSRRAPRRGCGLPRRRRRAVRDERERAPAALGAAVEHDRAGLGDRQRAGGEHAVDGVEPSCGEQQVVGEQLDARRCRRPAADRDAARSMLAARCRDRLGGAPRSTRRTVARYSAAGSQKRATTTYSPAAAPAPEPGSRADVRHRDARAERGLDAGQSISRARAAGPCRRASRLLTSRSRSRCAHQSRNVCRAGPGGRASRSSRSAGPASAQAGRCRAAPTAAHARSGHEWGTRARGRPSRRARGSSGSSPPARPGRAGAPAPTGCRS